METTLFSCSLLLLLLLHLSPSLASQPLLLPDELYHYLPATTGIGSPSDDNWIILNPSFEDGLDNWTTTGCKLELHESMGNGRMVPQVGKFFASATGRTETWNGIGQEITGRVQREVAYQVTALVRVYNSDNVTTSADVQATLWVQESDSREEFIAIAKLQVTDTEWMQLQGEFLLNGFPSRAVIYVEGPPPGTDILLNSLYVSPPKKILGSPARPFSQDALYGVNIILNSDLDDGTQGWFPLGNCHLSIATGSPAEIPPMARDSLRAHQSNSGRYLMVTNRLEAWMGPGQMITDKLRLYLTYQVSAWVRISPGANSSQLVNVAVGVDGQWINGGEAECGDGKWHEVGGSFRIEKQPSQALVYVQGPASGVDLMVAGLKIFPINRKARFNFLKTQTDKIRKRDVVLKFEGPGSSNTLGNSIRVGQIQNIFPLGSCITRTSIDNDKFVNFLIRNFNWAVFENEFKWSWTEPQEGILKYKEADELVDFCKSHDLQMRGHCIFWEAEYAIQSWVRSLNETSLMSSVQNRLADLLTRYRGDFQHYDVNNEMLHGSFYPDRLGNDIRANMFKTAHQLDPSATLFVNDYHIEDGSDIMSTPEKYIQQVADLQKQGAPIGGIGVQGHINVPVGPIVSSALDKLGTLGLPVWITELDVSSANEYIRADDLEVMLREAFAHPAVEGVILWGFWELYMSRKNAHLLDADGKINQAGRRFLALRKEWLTFANGQIDIHGEFRFRGFPGTYNVEVISYSKAVNATFVVDKGKTPIVVSINL